MSTYGVLISIHVLIAIFGLGQLVTFPTSLRNVRFALLGLFTTGAALDFHAGGAWHEMTWFRVSALLLVLTGVLSVFAARALKSGNPRTARRFTWAMCGTVAVITALMELKP